MTEQRAVPRTFARARHRGQHEGAGSAAPKTQEGEEEVAPERFVQIKCVFLLCFGFFFLEEKRIKADTQ
jgi:hypothetical protein